MGILNFLFGFHGKISRGSWWLGMVIIAIVSMTLSFLAVLLQSETLVFVPAIATLWPWLAISAKRWHDRGKSGLWSLITLIPIIGGLWMLVVCGFLRGKRARNAFGS